ncbi:hypothetical protein V2A60_002038 [Cordyceps javanica]|uniref:SH3 domain-containing protein n=1 Tax=Cordyceps javanica TaxID=43265 RepID=A0A545VH33_9HYPO|nr:SH3 domain-containing protein [Cordyceps javanica]TQW12181.1 SH3 domain-containing protein [Cordyceps javanica]
MVSADRQTIMETNRSLRNIKNELENLLEKGVIDENVFDTISATLPPESSLSGPLRTTANTGGGGGGGGAPSNPSPAAASPPPATRDYSSNYNAQPPTQGFQNMHLNAAASPGPPSYNDTPAPGVPPRGASGRPIIAHARALYHYGASDARDLTFEKDDRIAVYEYMNQDWWMGMNQRTGQEGIFPRNYVLPEQDHKAPGPYGPPHQQQQQQPQYGYPAGPPQQQNPYNANVPPMAVADGGGQQQQQQQEGEGGAGGKAGEMGKKFGKKLGNAAIFGAGASIGSNIVNSIF